MNLTILLALLVAWAAIYILKKVAVQLLLRKVGRAALGEVGKRALTRLPEQVSLVPTDTPAWTNAAAVEQQAAPLRQEGFTDLGVYRVDKMPGALIRMMAHPQTNVAAHICDHPRSGNWIEFVTRYTDGSTHSLSTLPPTGMDHPEWFRKIQADRSTPADQLYRQFLTQREWHGIKAVAPAEAVHEFEKNFRKLAVWRQDRGITPEEVAHVAVKKYGKNQAAAGTSR